MMIPSRPQHPRLPALFRGSLVLSGIAVAAVRAGTAETQTPPYPPSPVVKDIHFGWSTHRWAAQGSDNVFFLAPKWLSDDGRDFTPTFAGGGRGKDNDSFNTVRGRFELRQGK